MFDLMYDVLRMMSRYIKSVSPMVWIYTGVGRGLCVGGFTWQFFLVESLG